MAEVTKVVASNASAATTALMSSTPLTHATAVPHTRHPNTSAASHTPAASASKRKADAATAATASSYVFLRIKRRRNEDPVERLVVQHESEASKQDAHGDSSTSSDAVNAQAAAAGDKATTTKAKPAGPADLLSAFTKLSTREKSFVFKRIDTMEQHQLEETHAAKWTERLKRKVKAMKDEPRMPLKKSVATTTAATTTSRTSQQHAQQQQERLRERRKSDAQRSRGLLAAATAVPSTATPSIALKQQQTLELPGVRLVDLETVRTTASFANSDENDSAAASADSASSVTLNGARLRPTRVLNPREREVDEAIWLAFRSNDFSAFFRLVDARPLDATTLHPTAFQRPADGATILMAAARHGRVDVIDRVLRFSGTSALVEDWDGTTAATFAARAGFPNVHIALRACEDAEREKDFVYDVYCVDVSASNDHSSNRSDQTIGTASDRPTDSAPVVEVSASVQRWLTQDANWHTDSDRVDEYLLASDAEGDFDDDNESIDSNDENHVDNDYPDEEDDASDDDAYDSDDSEQSTEHRRIWTRRPSDEGETKDDDELDY